MAMALLHRKSAQCTSMASVSQQMIKKRLVGIRLPLTEARRRERQTWDDAIATDAAFHKTTGRPFACYALRRKQAMQLRSLIWESLTAAAVESLEITLKR